MVHSSLNLFYTEGSSDKVYNIEITGEGNRWFVPFAYGRQGSTLNTGFKAQAVPLDDAIRAYNKTVGEKVAKGYTDDPSGRPGTFSGDMGQVRSQGVPAAVPVGRNARPIPGPTHDGVRPQGAPTPVAVGPARWPVQVLDEVMEESGIQTMLHDDDWWAQQKHDGKRMVLENTPGPSDSITMVAYNKKGLQCSCPVRYMQAAENSACRFVLDGESVGDTYWAFDLLSLDGIDLRNLPYSDRLTKLEALRQTFMGSSAIQVVTTAASEQAKRNLLRNLQQEGREGIVFKRNDGRYQAGIHATQIKYKFTATCTCRVVAQNAKSSVQLGMGIDANDADGIVPVGNVTIPQGRPKPAVGTLVEIRYLYARRGGSLYQPVFLGMRDESEATLDPISKLKIKDEALSDDAEEAPAAPATPVAPTGTVMGTVRLIRWG